MTRFDRDTLTYDSQRELIDALLEFDKQYADQRVRLVARTLLYQSFQVHCIAAEMVRIPHEWRTREKDDLRRYTRAVNSAHNSRFDNPYDIPREHLVAYVQVHL